MNTGTIDSFIKQCIKRLPLQSKCAFISSILGGLFAHMYMFANKLPNHDDLHYGFDLRLDSSINNIYDMYRWALPTIANFSGAWSCPWLIGVISLILIGVACAVTVKIIDIQSTFIASLTGVMMVSFPTVTGTFLYMMTADGYFYSLCFACVAACLLTSQRINTVVCILLSILMISVSLGCYQGYLPVCCCLIIMHLIKCYLHQKYTEMDVAKCLIRSGISITGGLAVYLFIGKLASFSGNRFSGKNGVPLSHIPERFYEALSDLAEFFIKGKFGSCTSFYSGVFAIVLAVSLIMLYKILRERCKEAKTCITVFGLLFLYLCSIILIYFLTTEYVHLLMIYSFSMIPIGFLVLADEIEINGKACGGKFLSFMVCAGIGLLCWNYIVVANHTYLAVQISDSQAYAFSIRLVERMEMTEGYKSEIPVVFIGKPSIENENTAFSTMLWKDNRITGSLSPDQMFGTAATAYNSYEDYLQQRVGWNHIIYRESDYVEGDIEEVKSLLKIYPDKESMAVINNMLYVRFE